MTQELNDASATLKYKIVGEAGDYQVMEQFGAYRLSKKRFKTIEAALNHANKLSKIDK